MFKIKFELILLAVFCIMMHSSCSNNSKEEILTQLGPCDTTTIGYANDIKPIIDQYCSTVGCHNSISVAGARNFDNHTVLQPQALNDKFLKSILHASGVSTMPKGSAKLDDCKIQKITRWINQGALNN